MGSMVFLVCSNYPEKVLLIGNVFIPCLLIHAVVSLATHCLQSVIFVLHYLK